MAEKTMNLSEDNVRTIVAVFESVMEDNQYNWNKMNRFIGSITLDEMFQLQSELKGWLKSDTEEDDDEWEVVDPDEYAGNMHCDTYGVCAGPSCRNYYNCHS